MAIDNFEIVSNDIIGIGFCYFGFVYLESEVVGIWNIKGFYFISYCICVQFMVGEGFLDQVLISFVVVEYVCFQNSIVGIQEGRAVGLQF